MTLLNQDTRIFTTCFLTNKISCVVIELSDVFTNPRFKGTRNLNKNHNQNRKIFVKLLS